MPFDAVRVLLLLALCFVPTLAAHASAPDGNPAGSPRFIVPADCVPTFPDVGCEHFAFAFIEAAAEAGFIAGFPDGTFRPNQFVLREATAVIVARAADRVLGDFAAYQPPPCKLDPFIDLHCTDALYKFIMYCVDHNLMKETYPEYFDGDDPISRGAVAVVLARLNDLTDHDLASFVPPPCGSETFEDAPCSFGLYRFIEYAKSKGLVSGFADGKFRPRISVTRAQLAVFITRAADLPL